MKVKELTFRGWGYTFDFIQLLSYLNQKDLIDISSSPYECISIKFKNIYVKIIHEDDSDKGNFFSTELNSIYWLNNIRLSQATEAKSSYLGLINFKPILRPVMQFFKKYSLTKLWNFLSLTSDILIKIYLRKFTDIFLIDKNTTYFKWDSLECDISMFNLTRKKWSIAEDVASGCSQVPFLYWSIFNKLKIK